ncbi:glycoside hydrolase family 47 protein [Aulographum hederae CBS 113979]|uniref:alpha-1,2-Mannosidase n=1 Tax=Aulographum hederae CBS 113979 TaxID=1176131 RepID=A0A6G1HD42_9PEZI|nr:glycoside hydrolase family 47 protein [Aulographum hederae CBS 113979]
MNILLRRWLLLCLVSLTLIYFLSSLSQLTLSRPPSRAPYNLDTDLPSDSPPPPKKHVNWSTYSPRNAPTSTIPLPRSTHAPSLPKIQARIFAETQEQGLERLERLQAVKDAFTHSWRGYTRHAWLHDELKPVTGEYRDVFGGWGATLVDSLDTLWIMGLEREFKVAVEAVAGIDFGTAGEDVLNVFETTIRYLGGLLAAYDLSGGRFPVLLEKAREVGGMLMGALDTPNHMPVTRWDWQLSAFSETEMEASNHAIASEVGSLTLEFTRLAQLTGEDRFYDAVQRITDEFERAQNGTRLPGLWPMMLNVRRLMFHTDNTFTLGGMSDSLYEYLPKQYLLLGGRVEQYQSMYTYALETAKKYLFFRPLHPENADILISGTTKMNGVGNPHLDPQGQHLTCFVAGMVALGAKAFEQPDDLAVAEKLMHGCIWAYDAMATGIMPELFRSAPCEDANNCTWSDERWYDGVNAFYKHQEGEKDASPAARARRLIELNKLPKGFTEITDGRYLLRPEAIESVWVMYRVTGDRKYQDVAWRMFTAISEATKTKFGHAGIQNVNDVGSGTIDVCESFWTAETLKYFYLVFADEGVVSLDEWVLNTEAHPFKRG